MFKALFSLVLVVSLCACETHDRRFYNNRPHKGHGLNLSKPGADPATSTSTLGSAPSDPALPPATPPAPAPAP